MFGGGLGPNEILADWVRWRGAAGLRGRRGLAARYPVQDENQPSCEVTFSRPVA